MELRNKKTWQVQGNLIGCVAGILCVRYSPSGEHLAIATYKDIQIWNPGKRAFIAKFQGHFAFNGAWNTSLAWTHDGKQLVSSGNGRDPTTRTWDSSTWMQVGEPWKGHADAVIMIALNPTGPLLHPHLETTRFAFGDFRIDEPSPYSNTPTQCFVSPSPRMAGTS